MKKNFALGILFIVIVGIISFIALKPNEDLEISSEKILDIIKPEIDNYCNQLDERVAHSACPTCRISSYDEVEKISNSLDVVEYILKRDGKTAVADIRIPLIYGQNTKTGESLATFEINQKGEIANKDLTLAECK